MRVQQGDGSHDYHVFVLGGTRPRWATTERQGVKVEMEGEDITSTDLLRKKKVIYFMIGLKGGGEMGRSVTGGAVRGGWWV